MAKVLIFDSGVGGLSIFNELQHSLTENQSLPCVYVMDNEVFPYGVRSTEELLPRILHICSSLVEEHKPDLLIVACNTASTFALPALRECLDIPVVGVVPAVKTAAEKSVTHHIGLIATPATIQREYTDQLINDHANHCEIHRLGSSELVQLSEQLFLDQLDIKTSLQSILDPFFADNPNIDHSVLGCTHFPLLLEPLKELYPNMQWIDSGAAIARRVHYLLEQAGIQDTLNLNLNPHPTPQNKEHHKLLFTAPQTSTQKLDIACQTVGAFAPAKHFPI